MLRGASVSSEILTVISGDIQPADTGPFDSNSFSLMNETGTASERLPLSALYFSISNGLCFSAIGG
jgi:hypothetical protein